MSNKNRNNARPTSPLSTMADALAGAAVIDAPVNVVDVIQTAPVALIEDEDADDIEQADEQVSNLIDFADLDGDTIHGNTGGALLPFGAIRFSRAKNPKTFLDPKTGSGSRTLITGIVTMLGPNGPTQFYSRFSIGLRWEANAEDDATPSISLPTQGGKFNPAYDTDDSATADAYELWKASALASGIAWLQEQQKKTPRSSSNAGSVPVAMKVSAASLGLTLKTTPKDAPTAK